MRDGIVRQFSLTEQMFRKREQRKEGNWNYFYEGTRVGGRSVQAGHKRLSDQFPLPLPSAVARGKTCCASLRRVSVLPKFVV